jgi:hypothetical protein
MTNQIALTLKTTPTIRTLTVPAKKLVFVLQQLFLILRMTLGRTAVLTATTLRRNSAPPGLNDRAQRPLAMAILLQAAVMVTTATTTTTKMAPIKIATKAHDMPSGAGRLPPIAIGGAANVVSDGLAVNLTITTSTALKSTYPINYK